MKASVTRPRPKGYFDDSAKKTRIKTSQDTFSKGDVLTRHDNEYISMYEMLFFPSPFVAVNLVKLAR